MLLALLRVVLLASSIAVCVVCSFDAVARCINSVDMVDSLWVCCCAAGCFFMLLLFRLLCLLVVYVVMHA